MTSIYDLSYSDIQKFLLSNNKRSKNKNEAYIITQDLLKNKNTIGHPTTVIEWMIAHNVLINEINIPNYRTCEIDNMSQEETNQLAKLLTMKGNNKSNVKNILKYLGKLDNYNLLDILPLDIIRLIIGYIDDSSITSLLISTKKISTYSKEYKLNAIRQAVQRELKHVNNTYKKYYSDKILDLKIGNRLIYDNRNYLILSGKRMVNVDLSGNIIGNTLTYNIIKEPHPYAKTKMFRWGVNSSNDSLKPGLLLFDFGPKINNMNSKYLKYKTVPTNESNAKPELNMMVLIRIYENGDKLNFYYIMEYVITAINKDSIQLTYVNDESVNDKPVYVIHYFKYYGIEKDLIISTVDLKIKHDKFTYEIHKIGGFNNNLIY